MPITYPITLCGVQGWNILPEPCRQLAYTQKRDIQLPLLFQRAKQLEVVNDCTKLPSLLGNYTQSYWNLTLHISKTHMRTTNISKADGRPVTHYSLCMAKFVFLSLLFIPTELVLGDILQDGNFHPEANVLLSPAEAQGFLFTIQNWQLFRESFGLLSSQILLQNFGLRSWWWLYPWYPDIFCHSQQDTILKT